MTNPSASAGRTRLHGWSTMVAMRRWHRPHPVAGSQILAFVMTMLFALAAITLLTLMVSGRIQPSTPSIVFCAMFAYGVVGVWGRYAAGVYVGERGLRMRSFQGLQTFAWSEIKAIHSDRSEVPDETDPAIWIVFNDGSRIEAPLKGSRILPGLAGRVNFTFSWRTRQPDLVLPMNEFEDALAVLRECLAKSRHGPLQFE